LAGDLPAHETVSAAFEAQAARTPDAVAIGDASGPVTYRELDVRANQLAHGLRQRGVRPGARVGLLLDRPVDAITAMLAVLKAGGAYVPLDHAAPPARQDSVVSLADTALILTDTARSTAVAGAPVASAREVAADQPVTRLPQLAGPSDPAYVIFTSGSTGLPKGVVVEHRNLLYTTWARRAYHGEPAGRFLTLFPLWFDGSVVPIYYALLTGGTVWCPEPDPVRVAELVDRHAVERFSSVPALYAQLLAATEPAKLSSLRTVCLAGERLPIELAQAHHRALPGTTLQNDYGPTEITVFCTAYQLDGPPDLEIPIGRPLPGARCLVLDERGRLLPVGAAGELYVGGPGVARGYLGQPELTERRFVADRVTGSGRLYRTGDLARWNHRGQLEYLGRIDRQVKIRGFRVEPGEVEAAITSHPDVAEAAVVPVTGITTRLAGYPAPKPGVNLDAGKLREFLQERLPDYLVPSHLVTVPSLPRTRNGKVDVTALPAPEADTGAPAVPPRTELERVLAEIVAGVLDRPEVGIHDGFFDLGGDSMLAITVVIRARARGIDLDVQRLFQNPTVAQMAAASAVTGTGTAVPTQGGTPATTQTSQ
jgi:amino acid adenylation domain-containing protein